MSIATTSVLPDAALELLAIVRGSRLDGLPAAAACTWIEVAGLAARVRPAIPDLVQRLADPKQRAWLAAEIAAQHDAVLGLHEHGAVMPLQFATVLRDPHAVEAALRTHAHSIHAYFDQIDGMDEWSCKAWVHVSDAVEPARSGADYLRARKQAETIRSTQIEEATQRCRAALSALQLDATAERALACAERRREDGARMVLNLALLIPRTGRARMAALAQRDDAAWSWTGPWPPYSFRPQLNAEPA